MKNTFTEKLRVQQNLQFTEAHVQKLDRNIMDIAKLYSKLCSWVCEPKTYEQFMRLNELKEEVKILRYKNKNISSKLRTDDTNTAKNGLRLCSNYFVAFEELTRNVTEYLNEVK
ncbi:hypothetical protein N9Y48_04315 [Zobellia sp.]|nr:hypothetical protein [Zobellia sp.]